MTAKRKRWRPSLPAGAIITTTREPVKFYTCFLAMARDSRGRRIETATIVSDRRMAATSDDEAMAGVRLHLARRFHRGECVVWG